MCGRCWDQLLSAVSSDYCCHCGLDASPYGIVHGRCPRCIDQDFHFDAIAKVGHYQDSLKQMLRRVKFSDRTELIPSLGALLEQVLALSPFKDQIDYLVGVPMHWRRRVFRGYNHAHLLAKNLNRGRYRISTDLVRIRYTPTQPRMASFAQRKNNVAGAFAVRRDHPFTDRCVCLVDDIKTSGATLNECAGILKQAGVRKVFALVVAVAADKA